MGPPIQLLKGPSPTFSIVYYVQRILKSVQPVRITDTYLTVCYIQVHLAVVSGPQFSHLWPSLTQYTFLIPDVNVYLISRNFMLCFIFNLLFLIMVHLAAVLVAQTI
jgi:hypothetical protein